MYVCLLYAVFQRTKNTEMEYFDKTCFCIQMIQFQIEYNINIMKEFFQNILVHVLCSIKTERIEKIQAGQGYFAVGL